MTKPGTNLIGIVQLISFLFEYCIPINVHIYIMKVLNISGTTNMHCTMNNEKAQYPQIEPDKYYTESSDSRRIDMEKNLVIHLFLILLLAIGILLPPFTFQHCVNAEIS